MEGKRRKCRSWMMMIMMMMRRGMMRLGRKRKWGEGGEEMEKEE